jgi:transposase
MIVIARLRWDRRTRAYLDRRVSEGKPKREAIRCLKRYVARELYELIARTPRQTTQPSTA